MDDAELLESVRKQFASQEELAKALGVSRTHISKIKTGAYKMPAWMYTKCIAMLPKSARSAHRYYSSNTSGIPSKQIKWLVGGKVT